MKGCSLFSAFLDQSQPPTLEVGLQFLGNISPKSSSNQWVRQSNLSEDVLHFSLQSTERLATIATVLIKLEHSRARTIITPFLRKTVFEPAMAQIRVQGEVFFLFCEVSDDHVCSIFLLEEDVKSLAIKRNSLTQLVTLPIELDEREIAYLEATPCTCTLHEPNWY